MTNETKIAMLVGTGIIIFIGILVSDYLAEKRSHTPSHPNDGLRVANTQSGQRGAPSRTQATGPEEPLPPPKADDAQAAGSGSPNELAADAMVTPHPDSERRGSQPGDTSPPDDNGGSSSGGNVPPHRLEGMERVHMVEQGENLRAIAEEYYGDREKWKMILEANRDKVAGPKSLRAGLQLTIPPADAERRNATPPPDDGTGAGSNGQPTSERGEGSTDGRKTHVVQKGESLSAIAEHYYGDPGYWRTVLEANRDELAGPRSLQPGMRLTIPDKRGQARGAE